MITTYSLRGRKDRKDAREESSFASLAVFACNVVLVAAAVTLATQKSEAHKPITSKYTYNDDVFPILRDKCASCHVEGGVAPMSLMTYELAYPWAESIRAELIAAHMPPWNAEDGFGELRKAHTLSAKELDVVLTWATGGNPQGDREKTLPAVTLKRGWATGKPDLVLAVPSEFALVADKMDDTHEWTLSTGTADARWVRAVDLLPGTPSIVRSAIVYVRTAAAGAPSGVAQPPSLSASASQGPGAAKTAGPEPDHIIARWLPGQDPEPIGNGVAFRLPAGAELGVRIHYRKTWQFEGKTMTDRSTVGVYFAPAQSAQELLALPITSPALETAAQNDRVTFSQTIDEDVQALALSPDQVPPNITVQVQAVRPDGSRAPMIRLNTRADWGRRYWFERPVALPRGSRIEVVATLQDPDLLSAAFAAPSAATTAARPSALRLSLNVIPGRAKPSAP